ncbi:coiled-coil domain-containing protein 58 [Folsomia candida]|uniref:Protein MIX23 n=1 Tax=Folsomia candida TaxID=158441 RepID=A0A226EKA6_FOLCA|nr:coiled-coil domain-containing protein 58 [Folsomia candida]XP_021948050.1 coiled-coil domain-containing protein 58 [Folsomia candida]OXA58135.1 Coiled-coil domain-containing protein 58 [Folsomia candida]
MSICDDISEFLDLLKTLRFVDDKLVNRLNTTIPTESFSAKVDAQVNCKDLFLQLVASHANRNQALGQCLTLSSEKLQNFKEQKKSNPNDLKNLRLLRTEQTKFRELQTQMNVEEVIQERSLRIYHERCRAFYKPGDN